MPFPTRKELVLLVASRVVGISLDAESVVLQDAAPPAASPKAIAGEVPIVTPAFPEASPYSQCLSSRRIQVYSNEPEVRAGA